MKTSLEGLPRAFDLEARKNLALPLELAPPLPNSKAGKREIGRVPKLAQDNIRRGPIAALLVLLSLFASSGAIAGAAPNGRDTVTRPGSARPGAAASTIRSADDLLADEAGDTASFVPPPPPRIVAEPLFAGPAQTIAPAAFSAPRAGAASPYRARAPPAA